MNIHPEHVAAISALGYTPEEARFLYIMAIHSGYFVPRQFLVSSGTKWGKRSNQFVTKLESRGHATWREYDRAGGVYHLVSKTIYRRIGNENLRNRRRHSIEFIRTRLLLLDFVLVNTSYDYLETEPDKLRFFCEDLGVPRTALPAKSYESAETEPTLRYFVDKFPLFVHRAGPASPALVTFSYVDPGQASLAGFANHIHAYLPLFRHLGDFSFVYITNSPVHSVSAEDCFLSMVKVPLQANVSSEVLRYFRLRNAWELKKYGSLPAEDVEWLKEATQRFHGERAPLSELPFFRTHRRSVASRSWQKLMRKEIRSEVHDRKPEAINSLANRSGAKPSRRATETASVRSLLRPHCVAELAAVACGSPK